MSDARQTGADTSLQARRLVMEWHRKLNRFYDLRNDDYPLIDAIAAALEAKERENEELRKALELIVDVWNRQCGRVFESMGDNNPRFEVIDASIKRAAELLKKKV